MTLALTSLIFPVASAAAAPAVKVTARSLETLSLLAAFSSFLASAYFLTTSLLG